VAGTDEIRAFLSEVRAFQEFTASELTALAGSLREKSLRKGQVLLRMGDTSDEMYIVRRGSLVISKPVTGRVEQVLARIGQGDFFGEMALFDHSPRSATVQAESDALLLVLDRGALERLTEQDPRAAAGTGSSAFWRAAEYAKTNEAWRYREIDTDHMIPINRPDELVELLLELT